MTINVNKEKTDQQTISITHIRIKYGLDSSWIHIVIEHNSSNARCWNNNRSFYSSPGKFPKYIIKYNFFFSVNPKSWLSEILKTCSALWVQKWHFPFFSFSHYILRKWWSFWFLELRIISGSLSLLSFLPKMLFPFLMTSALSCSS